MIKMNGIPREERKIVCNSCGKVLPDTHDGTPQGEFWHSAREGIACVNNNKSFFLDLTHIEDNGRKVYETPPKGFSMFEKKAVRKVNTKKMARRARRARTYK